MSGLFEAVYAQGPIHHIRKTGYAFCDFCGLFGDTLVHALVDRAEHGFAVLWNDAIKLPANSALGGFQG
jgi:hypothetical protein